MTVDQTHAPVIGDESQAAQTKSLFLDCLQLVERLHRRLLDILKNRLDGMDKSEINAVQALLVYNIGSHEMTAGELRTRGYYLGSNVSYNLKKLVEMGYIDHQRAEHDRRSVRISLTDKGHEIRNLIDEVYDEQLAEILGDDLLDAGNFRELRKHLRNLERFWTDQLRFAG